MEVRHDLDVEAAETADSLGLAFARAATPGSHPRFVSMITELVRERLALPDNPAPDHPALGSMGVPSHDCPADCCRHVAAFSSPAGRGVVPEGARQSPGGVSRP
jgi:ferrochelatase